MGMCFSQVLKEAAKKTVWPPWFHVNTTGMRSSLLASFCGSAAPWAEGSGGA
eukprot:CAMPEP_0171133138 /NCGR_PEP_ID=MMETSP0766_2-20121228/125796_1 /TAXON_ID=439317 /ORGANISM="Gambierdiscus australes, Strain CAWD 149" /LENGTH=51 /DNA_ID=CAMNT_0011596507 /DNA_START=36 /DNA_END=188 /DNA_ORIENTATION=+